MKKEKTAGELSLKAASDATKYDPLEVAHALTDDVYEQLCICADRHDKIFDEDEFCLVLVVAGDPLLYNARRHKYYAYLFLPEPRPQQSVFLYNKITKKFKRLWSLPDAKVMAIISEMGYVAPEWRMTKGWCDSFFNKTFFEDIRHQYGITMPSEKEFLEAHHEKVVKPTLDNGRASLTDSFDFSKIKTDQVIDSNISLAQ